MQFYTYIHLRPTKEAFYVGKGVGPRINPTHFRNSYHSNIIKKHGVDSVTAIKLPCHTEDAALSLEKVLISAYRIKGSRLSNLTDGGEGVSGLVQSEHCKKASRERILAKPPMSYPGAAEKQSASMRKFQKARINAGVHNFIVAHPSRAYPETWARGMQKSGETQRRQFEEGTHHLAKTYPFAGKPELREQTNQKISIAKKKAVEDGTHNWAKTPAMRPGYKNMLDETGKLRHVQKEDIERRVLEGWTFVVRKA